MKKRCLKYMIIMMIFISCKSTSQNTKVINFTDAKYLDTIVEIGLRYLDLNPKVLQIKNLNKKENDIYTIGYAVKEKGNFVIYIRDDVSKEVKIECIAHELIHIKQLYDKKLYLKKGVVTYKGRKYNPSSYKYPTYFNRPWERDAFFQSPFLEFLIKEEYYNNNKIKL